MGEPVPHQASGAARLTALDISVPVHPIPAAPIYLGDDVLLELMEYRNEGEFLSVTDQHIVYVCKDGALESLMRNLKPRNNPEASKLAGNAMKRLASVAVAKDHSVWIPRGAITSANVNVFQLHRRGKLLTRKQNIYYYTVTVNGSCTLHFLQQQARNRDRAQTMFRKVALALMGAEGKWRLAELGVA